MKLKIAFFLLFLAAIFTPIYAKEYSISNATLDYYLLSDGSVIAIENITYILESGSFTQLYLQK
ncbi:MAG: hypothetical protein V1822_02450, partial [Candidatus Micrarchaeota archaeon]